MIHFNERLPRTAAERDLIESAARLTEGMTADEMDEMEREIAAERVAANTPPAPKPGMRVELTGTPTAVTLRSRTGTVVREDEDGEYVVVALDTPALYRHRNGEVEELPEIVVMVDNLRVRRSER